MPGRNANQKNRPPTGRNEPMDATAIRASLPDTARAALEPSARGARLRRRTLAVGGFTLLVLGFLFAVGLGRFVLLVVLAVLAATAGLALLGLLRGRGDLVVGHAAGAAKSLGRAGSVAGSGAAKTLGRAGTVAGSSAARTLGRAGSAAGSAARTQVERAAKSERLHGRRSSDSARREVTRLNGRGIELRRRGDPAGAIEAHRAALELLHGLDDRATEALTLNNLALALGHAGEEQAAIEHFDRAAAILRELDDEHHEGQVFANLGLLHGRSGRHEQAVYCLQAALDRLEPGSQAFQRVEEQLRRAS
jgi:tetratricopeptide (TPR) repeat protein